MIEDYKSILFPIIFPALLIGSVALIIFILTSLGVIKKDGHIEQALEMIIENKTGLEIDLSPEES